MSKNIDTVTTFDVPECFAKANKIQATSEIIALKFI